MSRQTLRFLIIVAIQLVILGVIVFFPDATKRRLFSDYEEVARPEISMRLLDDDVDETVRAIDEAGLFERYRWTRAVGVERPELALLVLPDYNFAQFWHFESFLVAAHDAGLGALILDLKDVPEFVPLRSKDGELRSTDERMQIFSNAAQKWLRGIGFSEISLVSFGTGAQSALDIIEHSEEKTFNAWIDISGMASAERWTLALSGGISWPSVFFVTGAQDRHLSDRKEMIRELNRKEFDANHQVIEETGSMLLNDEGKLDRDVEDTVIENIFSWAKQAAGK